MNLARSADAAGSAALRRRPVQNARSALPQAAMAHGVKLTRQLSAAKPSSNGRMARVAVTREPRLQGFGASRSATVTRASDKLWSA